MQSLAQVRADHLLRQRDRPVGVDPAVDQVRRQHRVGQPGADEVAERAQLHRLRGAGHVDQAQVAVVVRQAVAGVVLERREQPFVVVRADEGGGVALGHRGLVGKTASQHTDDRRRRLVRLVVRIAAQVDHRAQVEVETRVLHHRRHVPVGGIGLLGRLAGRHLFGRRRVLEAVAGAQPLHQAALLVERDQQRQRRQRVGRLQRRVQRPHLPGAGDVVAKQDHATQLPGADLRQRLLHGGRRRIGAVDAHHHHLAGLLRQRQRLLAGPGLAAGQREARQAQGKDLRHAGQAWRRPRTHHFRQGHPVILRGAHRAPLAPGQPAGTGGYHGPPPPLPLD